MPVKEVSVLSVLNDNFFDAKVFSNEIKHHQKTLYLENL